MYDHILDPLGDVILTLRNPNAPFAPWHGDDNEKPSSSTAESVASEETAATQEPVTFLVSSRHLTLASPVLRAALTGGWKESVARNTDDRREIATECWDVEAMVITMSIIHHKWSQVPREVGLELLGKVAVVVDYYQIYETVQLIGSLWVEHLRKPLPDSYGRELVLWLCISSVFRIYDVFRDITQVAIRHTPRDIETLQLPIPSAAIDEINNQRRRIHRDISKDIEVLLQKFLGGDGGCDDACRSIQLGTLMQEMYRLGLVEHRLKDGMSISELINRVRKIEPPTWYGNSSGCSGYHRRDYLSKCCLKPHRCSNSSPQNIALFIGKSIECESFTKSSSMLKGSLEVITSGVERNMEGLDLNNSYI